MTPSTLAVELSNDGLLRLNRPEQLNAFTIEIAEELEALFRSASLDDETTY